ncbi:SpaA isopeptide-forming pilin-related protein [Vagococcus silagei]|nr:SpaA isopeptide-forming pilin-related protein [Vagococcus silagei]
MNNVEAAVPPPPKEAQNALGFEISDFTIPDPKNHVVTNNARLSRAYSNVVEITQDVKYQYGVMWYKDTIDITKNFAFECYVYLGDKPHSKGGADGITVTFHNDPLKLNATGGSGQGMGAYPGPGPTNWQDYGVITKGVSFEADTYFNGGNDNYDVTLQADTRNQGHIGVVLLQKTFAEQRKRNHEAVGYINDSKKSLTDNTWRKLKVNWDSKNKQMNFALEGFNSIMYPIPNPQSLFGSSSIYWGMTGSTGAYHNSQHVALTKLPNEPAPKITKTVRNAEVGGPWGKQTVAKRRELVEYEIKITNSDKLNNIGPIKGAKFMDVLPPGLRFVSWELYNPDGTKTPLAKLHWDAMQTRGYMNYGKGSGFIHNVDDTYTFKIRAAVNDDAKPGIYKNVASVSGRNINSVGKIEDYANVQVDEYLGKIEIFKYGLNKKPLAGAVFDIVDLKTNQKVVSNATTNAQGIYLSPLLEMGMYNVIETKAPPGYVLPEKTKTMINIYRPGGVHRVEVFNGLPNSIKIVKEDGATGAKLAGAKFKITRMNGEVLAGPDKAITNAQGEFTLGGLRDDTYLVTEVTPPSGYENATTPSQNGYVSGGETKTFTFKNKRKTGKAKIIKVDNDNKQKRLPNAIFRILSAQTNGQTVEDTLKTNANGEVLSRDLPLGRYYVQETNAPPGYDLNSTMFPVDIVEGKISEVTVTNNIKPGSLNIIKVDKEVPTKKLAGAEFSIVRVNDGITTPAIPNKTTDANGLISLTQLKPGKYTVTEVKAPTGYDKANPASKQIEVLPSQSVSLQFENTRIKKGKVKIVKVDEATPTKFLAGATFKLTTTETGGTTVQDNLVTNTNGEIISNELPIGKYYLHETKAPNGYELNKSVYPVTIVDGQTVEVKVTNKRLVGNLTILKVDRDEPKKGLENAEFSVIMDNNGVPTPISPNKATNKDGRIELTNLTPGKYTVTEVKAPAGYEKDNPVSKTIEVKASETAKLQFENSKILGQIKLIKVDQSDQAKRLPGATFEFGKKQGTTLTVLETLVTDNKGEVLTKKYEPGTYFLRETKAPEGYEIVETALREITISGSGIQTVTFKNLEKQMVKVIHVRQSVLTPNVEVVIPKKGYVDFVSSSGSEEFSIIANSSIFDKPAEIKQDLFTSRIVNVSEDKITAKYRLPEYYQLVGSIVTNTDNNLGMEHYSGNTTKLNNNDVILDFNQSEEYWITYFIKPSIELKQSPNFYSWHNLMNDFGSFTPEK